MLPSRPLVTMASSGASGLTLQRFLHPPSTIDVPGLRDHLLVDHLAGPVLVEEESGDGRRQRRWTGPGQVTVTPAGQPVRRILKGRPDVVLLHLAPDFLNDVAREVCGRDARAVTPASSLAVPDQTADRLVRLLLADAEAPGAGSSLMTEALGRALAIHLLRFHLDPAAAPLGGAAAASSPRIQRVIDLMRSRLDEELPLARLASVAGLSASQLVRAFREATGAPPHRYLRGLRIGKAQALLEGSDLPVIDIALTCGFGQPGHFATVFREATGFSPRAWRTARRA